MRKIRALTAIILALALCLAAPAARAQEAQMPMLTDSEAMQALVEGYIEEKGLDGDDISVGYCYTATGETWYYNENKWYYSASMYKVPLMMIFAEKEYLGELTQESELKGLSLAQAEEYILVYSNNDYAHLMMSWLGTDRECRELYQSYSQLPVEDYDSDFYDYSYFSARFMTDVMKTLYFDQERFPHIIDYLKRAQPGDYFKASLGEEYEVAQKYGSYKEFNSTTGIIYTPNPFILTVMTEDMSIAMGEAAIADMARLFAEYTLELDESLLLYEQEQEQLRLEEEQERQRLEEEQRLALVAQQQQEAPSPSPELPAEEAPGEGRSMGVMIAIGLALAAVLVLSAVIAGSAKKRRKVGAAASGGGAKRPGGPRRGYRPRH